jgi:2-keto-3-deoxy-L-rhamnonate aldolase RhmA
MNGAQLREKMRNGERVYGTMTSMVRNPRWAGVYGRLALAFLGAGVCPIQRVKDSEPHATVMSLDAGFHGVLVPYCETADEVRAVVNAARLRPLKGELHERAVTSGEFPSAATREYLEERNKNVIVIIGIESVPAMDNLESILDVPGIDAIFIGPNDLSVSLGIPDEYSNQKFIDATERIISTAQNRGIPAGGHWQTPEQVHYWQSRGSRWILYSSDARALTEGYRESLNAFRRGGVSEMAHTL